jgi:hypothetical protein
MADSKINVLILTATITPPVRALNLARIEPKIRLSDYRKALEFYLTYLADGKISHLIFAENSASDLTELKHLCKEYDLTQKIEFISFEGLDYSPTYGRGYGEFKMIDYVMEHSQVIQQLPTQANIWKVTGRYIISNLGDIVRTRPSNVDFYCHCRNFPLHWIDLYILCWNKKAYNGVLKNICQLIREDIIVGAPEQAFRKIVDEQNSKIVIAKRFRTLPKIEGIRGIDNQSYQDMKLKFFLRKISNLLIPWLWI